MNIRFILRTSRKFLYRIKEILFLRPRAQWFPHPISEPLKEDPNDLVNVHIPNIKEYSMTFLANGKKKTIYDWWYSAILKDVEGNLFFLVFSFHPKWSFYRLKQIGDSTHRLTSPQQCPEFGGNFNAIGYSELNDSIVLWVPKTAEPHFTEKPFSKCEIKADGSHLVLITDELSVDLVFSNLGMPYWINKGREAIFSPRGDKISGFYNISECNGSINIHKKTVRVSGVGINEHLLSYNNVFGVREWERTDAIWFSTDQIYGGFLYGLWKVHAEKFVELKDGAIIFKTTNEYLVPLDFKINYLEFIPHTSVPSKIQIVATTTKGELNIEAEVLAVIQNYQLAFKIIEATFTFINEKKMQLTNGYGQHNLH